LDVAKGGDVYTFLMSMRSFGIFLRRFVFWQSVLALKLISSRGMSKQTLTKGRCIEVNSFAKRVLSLCLDQTFQQANAAMKYLIDRGVTQKVIETFKLGFCLPQQECGWSKYLLEKQKI